MYQSGFSGFLASSCCSLVSGFEAENSARRTFLTTGRTFLITGWSLADLSLEVGLPVDTLERDDWVDFWVSTSASFSPLSASLFLLLGVVLSSSVGVVTCTSVELWFVLFPLLLSLSAALALVVTLVSALVVTLVPAPVVTLVSAALATLAFAPKSRVIPNNTEAAPTVNFLIPKCDWRSAASSILLIRLFLDTILMPPSS